MARRSGGTAELEAGISQEPVPAKEINTALARAVASYKVPNEVVQKVAERLANVDVRIRGLDVCPYGICIDLFFTDAGWPEKLSQFIKMDRAQLGRIEVLVNGIPYPDIFRVRVEQRFEEMPQLAGMPGR